MIEKIGFNQDIKKFIIKNIPESYDFDKLLDLINKLELESDYDKCVKLIAKYIPKSYDFNKLLVLINKLDCDYDKRVRLLAKYIPQLYDFKKLSMGLVRDLWKIVDTYYIVLISLSEINIINPKGTIYRNIKSPNEIQDVCYSENKHLIAYHNKKYIYVYNIELDACIFRKKKYVIMNLR
nr:BTB domain containing protein [Mimivirus sp.]